MLIKISKHLPYKICLLNESHVPLVLNVYKSNPAYFEACPPAPNENSVLHDMQALPPLCSKEQKQYMGVFKNNTLLAVIDLILHSPSKSILWIGLLMVNGSVHGQGLGKQILQAIELSAKELGLDAIQLGCMQKNTPALQFWKAMGYAPTKRTGTATDVIILEKQI